VSTTKTQATDRLNLYTWFPFKLGSCGELQDVILVDEWAFEMNVTFSHNADLYPAKIPKNFMGYPINIGTVGIDPYVIMTENFSHNDDITAYKLTGLSVEIIKSVCENMNMTYVFLPPSLNIEPESYAKSFTDLDDGISEILTGLIYLIPLVVTSDFETTIPYIYGNMKMFVPSPKAIPGTEKILTIFSMTVWLSIALVLLLTTAVFWCAGNGPYRSVCNETHTYGPLSNCFQNTWSVFVAVSVPQQPTNSRLRVFFFLYVCFCFAISTVFQAFFVSYLVEPKYEKKIENLDELLHSDVVYGYYPTLQFIFATVSHPEFVTFFELKENKEKCGGMRECMERMITKKDVAVVNDPELATYLARDMATVDVGKIICPLEETLLSVSLTMIFKKGNPLLERFNILMRRYFEAGMPEMLLAELQHAASLRGERRFRDASGSIFFSRSQFLT